jgi:hypothetical protein
MKPARQVSHRNLFFSVALSTAILIIGVFLIEELSIQSIYAKLAFPLLRLLLFIGVGLVVGQIVEATGWTRFLGSLTEPIFRFGNLGHRCSAAFTTAFVSGVAANAMLLEFYKEGKISRKQLFLSNFTNQFPAYFLHLPTTFFVVIPLTGRAGAFYFLITFLATLLRTTLFLVYGHLHAPIQPAELDTDDISLPMNPEKRKKRQIGKEIKENFPGRITRIAAYVVPIYSFIFVLNAMGTFTAARMWLARYVATQVIPMEALSVVIVSFAAEFTSGFAAAGALLNAGILTIKQTVLALLAGNIVAFPIRALRHQLPRYIGIFSPKMGTQLLLMGQGFRVLSLVFVGFVYYFLG